MRKCRVGKKVNFGKDWGCVTRGRDRKVEFTAKVNYFKFKWSDGLTQRPTLW